MRIGMMADTYKPHISGITNYIDLNKRYLERAGHEVYVFTFGDLDYSDDELHVIRSPGVPLMDTGYYLSLSYSRAAKHLLQRMDVVHVHHPFLSGRLALRYCRPLRIPIVFTNHTRYDLYAQTYLGLPDEIAEGLLRTYMPSFCEAVDMVISPSEGMAGVLRKLGVTTPIEIVPNGVDIKIFQAADGNCRAEFGFGREDVLLVYAGRLAPEKNLEFLLQAFNGVVETVPQAHLLFIGGGPLEESLRAQAKQSTAPHHIHFTGMQPHEAVAPCLAMSDLFVTASITEVHPLSVIEAMAAGLPVLGIHSVGVGDIVEDGYTGLLSSHDLAAFTAHMTRLCIDKDLRLKLSNAARQAAQKYAIEHTTRLMLERYQKLIEEASPRQQQLGVRLRTTWERFIR